MREQMILRKLLKVSEDKQRDLERCNEETPHVA
jgi:hypothetical protein